MGFVLQKIAGAALLPPGILVLVLLAGLSVRSRRPYAAVLLYAATAGFWLLSTPWVAQRLLQAQETVAPLTRPSADAADAIVVLGGGTRQNAPEYGGQTVSEYALERVRYAARLHRLTGLPILVSGGSPNNSVAEAPLMARALAEDFRVPVRWVEDASLDTADNARLSAAMLLPEHRRRIYLVSHAWHLPRAVPAFEAQGFSVVPAPTGFTGTGSNPVLELLPSGYAFWQSSNACREMLGRAWYALARGARAGR